MAFKLVGITDRAEMDMGGIKLGISCMKELDTTSKISYGMGVTTINSLSMLIGILVHGGMTSICNPCMLGKIDMGIFVSMGDMHTMVMTSRGGMKTMDMGGIGTRLMGTWGMSKLF